MQEGWGLWEVLWLYFFVNMKCCGTREEKVKLTICACIGFGRHMDVVSAWGRWTHGVSERLRLDLIEGRAGLREWQDVAGSRWFLVVQFSSRCSRGLT